MRARRLLILSAILISFARGDLCGASSICFCRRWSFSSDMSSVTSATRSATRSLNFCTSSSRVVSVSSMVSCSQPAATSSASVPSVTVASKLATSARWLTYGSLPRPLRAFPEWRRAAKSAASETRRRPVSMASQLPHHVPAKAVDDALACQRDELHITGLAGLEAHRGAGGDIEPHAAGLVSVEFQGRIGFEEVVVRADLDRAVAGVRYRQRHSLAAGVEFDLAVLDEEFAGDHVWYLVTRSSVMAGLVPAIHVLSLGSKDVDARDTPMHDETEGSALLIV